MEKDFCGGEYSSLDGIIAQLVIDKIESMEESIERIEKKIDAIFNFLSLKNE